MIWPFRSRKRRPASGGKKPAPSFSGIPSKQPDICCGELAEPKIYYHYTSLGALWAILDKETLRATQARFSNDSEEIKKGAELFREICEEHRKADGDLLAEYARNLVSGEKDSIDCYIACFCGQGDILSQWRGYCRSDGVSIGFAFDETRPQFYLENASGEKRSRLDVKLYRVWYMSDRKESVGNTISRDDLTAKIVERLEEIEELSDMQMCKAFVDKNIPLIKHAGFREEDEYRLLICNTQAEFRSMVPCPLDSYVEYLPENNVQRPILTLHFDGGGSGKVDGDVTVRLRLCNIKAEEEKELKYQLKGKLKDQNGEEIGCRLEYVTEKWGEQPQIIIGRADDSLQRNVFEAIDRVLTAGAACEDKKMFQGVKLWCEGHLPVRSIRVSPCENQEDVVESIRHYCVHHKYWLKYVDVTGSEIPYRRPK